MNMPGCPATTRLRPPPAQLHLPPSVAPSIPKCLLANSSLPSQKDGGRAGVQANATTVPVSYPRRRPPYCGPKRFGGTPLVPHSAHRTIRLRHISSDDRPLSSQVSSHRNLRETLQRSALAVDHVPHTLSSSRLKPSRAVIHPQILTMFILFLYIIGLVPPASAYPTPQQFLPIPSASSTPTSSFNWWPYTNLGQSVVSLIAPTSSTMSMLTLSSHTSTSTSPLVTSTSSSSSISATEQSTTTRQVSSSPESTTSPSPSTMQSSTTPLSNFKLAYLFPIVAVIGVIIGASCAAVIIRPWARKPRKQSPKPGHHPFPADGGLMPLPSPLDEEEKQWIASKSSYSDDAYHTVDESDEEMNQLPQSKLLSPSVADELELDVTSDRPNYDLPLELEEIDLRTLSNGPRSSINARLRQTMQQSSRRSSRNAFGLVTEKPSVVPRPPVHSMLSPLATNVFSPPLMKDLFFLDKAPRACSRDAWGTAESILGNGDSEEEADLQGVIMSAGSSSHGATKRHPPPPSSDSFQNPVRVPPSLSTLSTTVRARKLVRSIPMRTIGQPDTLENKKLPSATGTTSCERGKDEQGPSMDQSNAWSDVYNGHSAALQTVADLIRSQWSRRVLSAEPTSPTLFGASLSPYASQDAYGDDNHRPRFGMTNRG